MLPEEIHRAKKHKKKQDSSKNKNFKKGSACKVAIALPETSVPDPIGETIDYSKSERHVRKKESMETSNEQPISEENWFKKHSKALKITGWIILGIILALCFAYGGYKIVMYYKRKQYSKVLTGGSKPTVVTVTPANESWSKFEDVSKPDYNINLNKDISSKYLSKEPRYPKSFVDKHGLKRDAHGRFVKKQSA